MNGDDAVVQRGGIAGGLLTVLSGRNGRRVVFDFKLAGFVDDQRTHILDLHARVIADGELRAGSVGIICDGQSRVAFHGQTRGIGRGMVGDLDIKAVDVQNDVAAIVRRTLDRQTFQNRDLTDQLDRMRIVFRVGKGFGQRPVFYNVLFDVVIVTRDVDLQIVALDDITRRVVLVGECFGFIEFIHDLIGMLGIGRSGIIIERRIIIQCIIDIHTQLDIGAGSVLLTGFRARGELAGGVDDDIDIRLSGIITGGILEGFTVVLYRVRSCIGAQTVSESHAVYAPVAVNVHIGQRSVGIGYFKAGINTVDEPVISSFVDNRSVGFLCAVFIQAADAGADAALHTCHGDHSFVAFLSDMQITCFAVDDIADVDADDIIGSVKAGRFFMDRDVSVCVGDLFIDNSVSEIAIRRDDVIFGQAFVHRPFDGTGLFLESGRGAHDDRGRFCGRSVLQILLCNTGDSDRLGVLAVHTVALYGFDLINAGSIVHQLRVERIVIIIYGIIDALGRFHFDQVALEQGSVDDLDPCVLIHVGSLLRRFGKLCYIGDMALDLSRIDDFDLAVQIRIAQTITRRACRDHAADHHR